MPRSKPRELAEAIAAKLRADDLVAKVEVAGPGFINLTLKPAAWIGALRAILAAGRTTAQRRRRGTAVNVEYVSANPTGPMHVGHCRGAVFGDALANLLGFTGFEVTREYYINDARRPGRRARALRLPALPRGAGRGHRRHSGRALSRRLPQAGRGGARRRVRRELLSKPETQWLPVVRDRAVDMMMAEIRNDLAALNVVHDVFFSERSLIEGARDQVGETIAALRARGTSTKGACRRPRARRSRTGRIASRRCSAATDFGDDVDRPLMKSDGSYTYFASDIAYHKNKFDRGFRSMIDVWGADHGGYVKRMQAAVNAVRAIAQRERRARRQDRPAGEALARRRAGQNVEARRRLRDVARSRGRGRRDAVRFMMLYRKNDAVLDFDLAKVIEQSRDNPVFYVQYGHARGQSVFRNAREVVPDLPSDDAARAAMLAARTA